MDVASEFTEHVCIECGTQYAKTERPPIACSICADERQFVNPQGQQWTTHGRLKRTHRNTVHSQGPGVTGIGVEPRVGIDSAHCWYGELTEMCCGTVSRCWMMDWRS